MARRTPTEPPKRKIGAALVMQAVRTHFHPPEWAVLEQVANGTGYVANRWIDALAVSLWPSRGQEAHAIEVKVSRADFRREGADPEKAEAIARFCRAFWIAAPTGVVPLDARRELGAIDALQGMHGLGLRGAAEHGADEAPRRRGRLGTALRGSHDRRAQRLGIDLEQPPCGRELLEEQVAKELDARVKQATHAIERKAHFAQTDLDRLRQEVETFTKATGIHPHETWLHGPVRDLVSAIHGAGGLAQALVSIELEVRRKAEALLVLTKAIEDVRKALDADADVKRSDGA